MIMINNPKGQRRRTSHLPSRTIASEVDGSSSRQNPTRHNGRGHRATGKGQFKSRGASYALNHSPDAPRHMAGCCGCTGCAMLLIIGAIILLLLMMAA
jgi:hypothetical protein